MSAAIMTAGAAGTREHTPEPCRRRAFESCQIQAHHWRIEEPSGMTSLGVCKVCGATRIFRNWLAEGDFLTNEEHRAAGAAA